MKDLFFHQDVPRLLEVAAQTRRFKDIQISRYVNHVDFENNKQFSAMIFSITPKLHFLAFRGIDSTLVGWKEELQTFFTNETKSRKEAIFYTEYALEALPGKFILGGHSKGGNLAIYAASQVEEQQQNRILQIYNYDGPGFHPEILVTEGYQRILSRITTILPETSIVGVFLNNNSRFKIVKSSGKNYLQHNPFLWEVVGNDFVYRKSLSARSEQISSTIRAWLSQLSLKDREKFVDSLLYILQQTQVNTLSEMNRKKRKIAESIITAFKEMDPSSRNHLRKTLRLLFIESHRTFKAYISRSK